MPQRSVALLIETSNAYCRGLLDGVLAYTKQNQNWSVYLTEQERGAMPPDWLSSWGGDGIIARIETDAIGRRLRQFHLPTVDLSAARYVRGVPWADTEDLAIARLAVEHFCELGFRNVGYCGDAGFAWSQTRGNHFVRLAKEHSRTVFEHHSVGRYEAGFDPIREQNRIATWLASLPRPIAIMGCYDFQAQRVLDACRQLGLAVPEQVAVLGVDNDRLICEFSQPTLSSIIPDTHATGYEAAALLDRMMDGEQIDDTCRLVTQPIDIFLRASTDALAVHDPEVVRAMAYIRKHATENIRVTDVLAGSKLSRRALEHRFRKAIGRTPAEEIGRIRINRIKEMLSETDLPIATIARSTGYEYSEYMTSVFKRSTGVTPTDYRLQHRPTPKA